MDRDDRRLHLVWAGASDAQRPLDERFRLADRLAVPQLAILVGQQHDGAVVGEARLGARKVQPHEGQQAHGLRFVGHEAH